MFNDFFAVLTKLSNDYIAKILNYMAQFELSLFTQTMLNRPTGILQWNIRGIFNNLENVRYFLFKYKPDLVF